MECMDMKLWGVKFRGNSITEMKCNGLESWAVEFLGMECMDIKLWGVKFRLWKRGDSVFGYISLINQSDRKDG